MRRQSLNLGSRVAKVAKTFGSDTRPKLLASFATLKFKADAPRMRPAVHDMGLRKTRERHGDQKRRLFKKAPDAVPTDVRRKE